MLTTVYRGDTRSPGEMVWYKGFYCKNGANLQICKRHLLEKLTTVNLLEITQWIVSTKDPHFVSFGIDEGCGGYGTQGNIYKISLDSVNWKQIVVKGKGRTNPLLEPTFWVNKNTIEDSDYIGIQHRKEEVTFPFGIPISFVTDYKLKDTDIWQSMKGVQPEQPAAKKLW